MGKFSFRLQSLLNVKRQMEDSLKNELGKAIRKLEEEKDELKGMENAREECIDGFNSGTSRGITVEKILEYNAYLALLNEKIARQKEYVNSLQKNVDKIRENLLKVMQERKMLDKLKERKYQNYLDESKREEQRLQDEVAGYKYERGMTVD